MWCYTNKISSLEEKASAQVAISLCHEIGFREVALQLEKPTYGGFIDTLYEASSFVSDPEKLSVWAKLKEEDMLCDAFMTSCCLENKVRQWDTAVDEQCRRLTEGIPLPDRLRQKIYPWMNRIALEYLSYSRRQEVLFGVSRYFLMNIFTRGDWKEAARLDERKLAQRLLEDEQLTVLQRYRIAYVYCLYEEIPQLWERLTRVEKRFTSKCDLFRDTHDLVFMWSLYLNTNQVEKVAWQEYRLWAEGTSCGDRVTLMVLWKEAQDRKETVIDKALESLQHWQYMAKEFCVKRKLVSNESLEEQLSGSIGDFYLPSYYCELVFFFLSQMDEEQQLKFFEMAFQSYFDRSGNCKSVLECFLEWPHQEDFLPMVNRFWGIIPKEQYGQCLFALASKYSGNDEIANRDYDYRSLLRALWEETPEEYKQYVCLDKNRNFSGNKLLSQLLKRSPFQEKDEALFKRIFRDQPLEKRRAMMHSKWGENSAEGETVYSLLMRKGKWAFLKELLDEIPDFKK